jgi:hypothetical protein
MLSGRRIQGEPDWSRFDGCRRVQVVGAQYHQPALLTVSKRFILVVTDRCEYDAALLREPDNEHDPNAIQVMVDGRRVGYLKRGTAQRLNRRVEALEAARSDERYPLLIRMKEPGFFQAHLQISYSSELLKGYKNPKRKRRRPAS